MLSVDILIVGAGIAGIQAAKEVRDAGFTVLIADRRDYLGGVLPQCTHRGFSGMLTGPEYLARQLEDFPEDIDVRLSTTVISVSRQRQAVLSSRRDGVCVIAFRQLIFAAGCRERAAGALPIGGTRPMGIFTAGQAQEACNLYGESLPDPIVILGSGDLGLIMAAQLTGRGQTVAAIIEKQLRCGGLARNRRAVEPLHIPLYTGAALQRIEGYPRLTGVQVRTGDGRIVSIPCRTLLIAAGMEPEQSLIRALGDPNWLHLCGNCKHIHAMVEAVAAEGTQAAQEACGRLRGNQHDR